MPRQGDDDDDDDDDDDECTFLPRDARSASWYCYRMLSVRLSVYLCLSARDVDVPWAYRLD